jgi:hypothetical protein
MLLASSLQPHIAAAPKSRMNPGVVVCVENHSSSKWKRRRVYTDGPPFGNQACSSVVARKEMGDQPLLGPNLPMDPGRRDANDSRGVAGAVVRPWPFGVPGTRTATAEPSRLGASTEALGCSATTGPEQAVGERELATLGLDVYGSCLQ